MQLSRPHRKPDPRVRRAAARRRTLTALFLLILIGLGVSFGFTFRRGGAVTVTTATYTARQLLIHQYGRAEQEGARWIMAGTVAPHYRLTLLHSEGEELSPSAPGYVVHPVVGTVKITVAKRWLGLFWLPWASIDLGQSPGGLPKLGAPGTQGYEAAVVEFESAFARVMNAWYLAE